MAITLQGNIVFKVVSFYGGGLSTHAMMGTKRLLVPESSPARI